MISPRKVEFGRDRTVWELFKIIIGRVGYEIIFLINHCFALIGFRDIPMVIKMVGVLIVVVIPCMLLCVAFFFIGEEESTEEEYQKVK